MCILYLHNHAFSIINVQCAQDNPESQCKGWKMLAATPDLNFLSQIVLLLFEDESEPVDSPSRYYVNLHIGSGVKARKQSLSEGVPFIDGETHSPSFVKRLPTVPVQRGSETNLLSYSSPVVRKVASYPSMHSTMSAFTPTRRRTSISFSQVPLQSTKSSPDSPVRKLPITYTDESLQTLGEPGKNYTILMYQHID